MLMLILRNLLQTRKIKLGSWI